MKKQTIFTILSTFGLLSLLVFAAWSPAVRGMTDEMVYLPLIQQGDGDGGMSTPITMITATPTATPSSTATATPTTTPTVTPSPTAVVPDTVDMIANYRGDEGSLGMTNQIVFGPNICTDYGDPFSPIDSPWEPGIYTYRYRIYIPNDFEAQTGQDVVRVELFDPDSVNSSASDVTIFYTEAWKAATDETDSSRFDSSCQFGGQEDSCVIATCEWADSPESSCNSFLGVEDELDINPLWYVRVDENRGNANGSMGCSNPNSYNTSTNTNTVYELYYFYEHPNGTLQRVPLASYTGQADNDNDYDDYSHNTDMNWVSPGAINSVGDVPTDCGSRNGGNENDDGDRCPGNSSVDSTPGEGNGFEVSLSLDTPGIAFESGNGGEGRYLYLDVTAIAGASENGYEIYAGPPDLYSDGSRVYVPSDVNARNLFIANQRYLASTGQTNPDGSAPFVRSSYGVTVYAMGNLPMNAMATIDFDMPLAYIPNELSGQELIVSVFDIDSNVTGASPADFFFDTLSRDDFKVRYDQLCTGGEWSCSSVWIGPPGNTYEPFRVDIPYYDPILCTDPDDEAQQHVCNPFAGGIFSVNYTLGKNDGVVWRVDFADEE